MAKMHVYEPLPGDDWIRLLHIFPGEHRDERLSGELKPVRLTAGVHYEALSYTWGKPEKTGSIFINDGRLPITANCASAIRNLRHETDTRIMWIDAISMNQADTAEKGHQVGMMGEIYSKAASTVIYLGPGDGTVRILRSHPNLSSGTIPYASSDQHSKFITARQQLAAREWHHRKWIIQEVLLSQRLVVLCGKHEFSWAEFEMLANDSPIVHLAKKFLHPSSEEAKRNTKLRAAWEEMFEQGEVVALDPRKRSTVHLARNEKYRIKETGFLTPTQLFDMLCMTSGFACKEPRDRIYALLSLFVVRTQINTDYDCSDQQVYQRLSEQFITLGDTRMLWLDHRESWRPRWSSALDTMLGFANRHSETNVKTRVSTDVGRLWKEIYAEQKLDIKHAVEQHVWKTSAVLLGSITAMAQQIFEHRPIPQGTLSTGVNEHSLSQWRSALRSLGLHEVDHENGSFPLSYVHQRNRESLDWFRTWTLDLFGRSNSNKSSEDPEALRRAAPKNHGHVTFCQNMQLFRCDLTAGRGMLLGLVSSTAQIDDLVYFLPGYNCPFVVLRPDAGRFELISLCWFGPLKLFPTISDKRISLFAKQNWEIIEIG